MESVWNSYSDLVAEWGLNFSTDLICKIHLSTHINRQNSNSIGCLVFCFPFFILNHLKLRRRQKLGLIFVFSLGAITMAVSLARFLAYNVTGFGLDDESGSK